MKAAVFQGVGRPHLIEDVPEPAPGPHDLIVAVERCGICGTDLHATSDHSHVHSSLRAFAARYQPGLILGHEFAGRVVAVGADVTRFAVGDALTSMGVAGCGRCESCVLGAPIWCAQKRSIQGGFAEYALANEFSALALPPELSMEEGALIEPLACSRHAVSLARLAPGARVLVLGAGLIGLGIVAFAREAGAGEIAVAARSSGRAALAMRMGATAFVQQGPDLGEAAVERLGGRPDYVFECVGAPGLIDQAIACAGPRTTVIVCGLCLAPDPIASAAAVLKELRLQFSIAYTMADFEAVADRMRASPGEMAGLVSSQIALADFPAAFESLRAPTHHCRVLVAPH